jgi:hypothetical protein
MNLSLTDILHAQTHKGLLSFFDAYSQTIQIRAGWSKWVFASKSAGEGLSQMIKVY